MSYPGYPESYLRLGDNRAAGVVAVGATLSLASIIVGVMVSHDVIVGIILIALGGLGFLGSIITGILTDAIYASPTEKQAESQVAAEEPSRIAEAGAALGGDRFMQTSPAVDVVVLLQMLKRMERRSSWLTWLTCLLGLAFSFVCAVFAEQLSHLSH